MVKVLIVDDEKLERILIRNGFAWEENGFEVIGEASSGEEALEVIEQKKPDLVLTDINMPHMTGLELTEKIYEIHEHCYVVIITGYREFEYARTAVRLGVEDFLLKPLDMEELKEVVLKLRDKVLEEKRLLQEKEQDSNSAVEEEYVPLEAEIEIDWTDFIFAVENNMVDKVNGYIEQYTDKIRQAGEINREYLRLMTMNMISKAGVTINQQGKSAVEVLGGENLYVEIGKITSSGEMRSFLMEKLATIIKFRKDINGKKNSRIIEQALEYIEENLTDPGLSLKTVAAAVFVNESYLSRIFKKEMSDSMIEYITKKRIAESIKLLNNTNLKAYEIAEKVGFRDSHYFSICFKKQVGVTVKEFKNSAG